MIRLSCEVCGQQATRTRYQNLILPEADDRAPYSQRVAYRIDSPRCEVHRDGSHSFSVLNIGSADPFPKDLINLRFILGPAFPTIVCLCGSTRFKEAFTDLQLQETLAGKIVLTIGCNMRSDTEIFGSLSEEDFNKTKETLDALHKRKIEISDEILVLDLDGYIGSSTASEIAHAKLKGVPVRYLSQEQPEYAFSSLSSKRGD